MERIHTDPGLRQRSSDGFAERGGRIDRHDLDPGPPRRIAGCEPPGDIQTEKEKADLASKQEQALTSAEKDAAQAEKEEQAALAAARNARSEAERSVHAELARLLGVTKEQAEYEKGLIERRAAAAAQHDEALKIRRELSDKIDQRESDPYFEGAPLDAEYDALRKRLKEARQQLSGALSELASQEYRVPVAGEDRLTELPEDINRDRVDAQRSKILAGAAELEKKEQEYLEERARLLMAEVEMLNRLRLRAIPELSSEKRDDLEAFNPTGFDQARSEARQVWLTLLYHYQATTNWAKHIRAGTGRTESAWVASLLALKWLLPVGILLWWRRRSEKFLNLWIAHARREAHKRVSADNQFDWNLTVPLFLKRVHRPLEYLLLIWSVLYLMPTDVAELLEIQLPVTVMRWTFGGALAVTAIDALSSNDLRQYPRTGLPQKSPELRLRSLRLVGRTVVIFGLILALSSKLVGKGTIYSWVFSTCWFAAIPVSLVVVAWWKPIIYERLELIRKKGKLENWILAQKQGATSFVAAIAGGAFLFGTGAARVFRSWVVTFTWVRRILAYLFRRDMSKKAGDEKLQLATLTPDQYATMGPERASAHIVASVADEQIRDVIRRIDAQGGGVYAIIGERGSGKTTTLERIAGADDRVTYVTCPTGGLVPFTEALNEALQLPKNAPFSAAAAQLDGGTEDTAVLVDDAQHLILPMMGGLKEFDRVLELARDTSVKCTWIFAVDEALWRFLERARGSRPLFDEAIHLAPWAETSIVQLLTQRNARAGISPSFENLLSNLPADADDVDIAEALQRTEAAYYRLLWDYASGNPAIALHFWRKCLGVDAKGKICVRLFQAAEAEDLEGLPDSAVFVLRATVQLGHASLEQVCAATSLPHAQVKDALRYGVAKGYFIHQDDHYRITWNWFRAITRFLKRRHMLFSG